jgi:hypothetical protein
MIIANYTGAPVTVNGKRHRPQGHAVLRYEISEHAGLPHRTARPVVDGLPPQIAGVAVLVPDDVFAVLACLMTYKQAARWDGDDIVYTPAFDIPF